MSTKSGEAHSQVAAKGWTSAALKLDGTVAIWGWNFMGQCNPPASITGATDIALGVYHTVVVADAVCAADLNGDRVVDGLDLIAVLVVWGTTGDGLPADFNRSGIVDGGDLSFVTSGWGACAD